MTANSVKLKLPLSAITAMILILVGASSAQAAAPVKLIPASHFGAEVDGKTGGNVCTIASGDECQPGKESASAGGFTFPEGVAGAPDGDIYVTDKANHRVQELEADGKFVLMFGKEVNATTKGDLCTAASGNICKSGLGGAAPGQFSRPESVTVDPTTGDVYVAEIVEEVEMGNVTFGERVQKLEADGTFVAEIGKEVNETTKGNLCTEQEVVEAGVKCGGPALSPPGTIEQPSEHGAFHFRQNNGDLLTVGEHGRLYVGDKGRVQEFEADGKWSGEIPVPAAFVTAIASDESTGDLYVVYDEGNIIHEFNPGGAEVNMFTVAAREPGAPFVLGIAVDSAGHLAVTEREEFEAKRSAFGSLYNGTTGHLITEYPGNGISISFNGNGELYAVAPGGQEVLAYKPVNVAELVTRPEVCAPGAEHETNETLDCALNGEVNPWSVPGAEAWFQWGDTAALGMETAKKPVVTGEALVGMSGVVEALRPNETLFYRLAGDDQNVQSPEVLTGEAESFTTPLVAPKIVGEPSAAFVKSASVVFSGELNPENAETEAFFEYGPGETLQSCPGVKHASCPGVEVTGGSQSGVYGKAGVTLEATGLQPASVYHYRLVAEGEGGQAPPVEGAPFTTAPAPVVQAATGPVSLLAATSASITGTVDGDGKPATFAFELGVYAGAETQYGIVLSGPVAESVTAVGESFALSGLQPATTYAYRITLSSGYGDAQGAAMTFTTTGDPSILTPPVPLAMLATPSIAFPKAVVTPKPAVGPKHKTKKQVQRKRRKSKKAAAGKRGSQRRKARKVKQ